MMYNITWIRFIFKHFVFTLMLTVHIWRILLYVSIHSCCNHICHTSVGGNNTACRVWFCCCRTFKKLIQESMLTIFVDTSVSYYTFSITNLYYCVPWFRYSLYCMCSYLTWCFNDFSYVDTRYSCCLTQTNTHQVPWLLTDYIWNDL